jgi:hypothetical protein
MRSLAAAAQVSLTDAGSSCVADLDFQLVGFSVTGVVALPAGCSLPEGGTGSSATLTLTLSPSGSAAGPLSVPVAADGSFTVSPVVPGDHVASLQHPLWALSGPVALSVPFGPMALPVTAGLAVTGFSLTGAVVAGGPSGTTSPLPGVSVFLYSAEAGAPVLSTLGCQEPTPGAALPVTGGGVPATAPLCVAVSDATGRFSFSGLPCAKFTVVPHKQVTFWRGGGRRGAPRARWQLPVAAS